ncbi:MAG: hypothetical protein H9864_04930, partial [Candidatus Faecalibacterium intestinavium]|nr:hypothetical protein [Candidatus Faecalibacterium intestinavium]
EAEQGPPSKFSSGVSARAGNLENGKPVGVCWRRAPIFARASVPQKKAAKRKRTGIQMKRQKLCRI